MVGRKARRTRTSLPADWPTPAVKRRCRVMLLALCTAAFFGLFGPKARADSTGQLYGTVVDDAEEPLGAVAISATSESMIGGALEVQSDPQGRFQYPRLAPGVYTVRFELAGHVTRELTGVQIRVDRTTQLVSVVLSRASFGDEIDVIETTPMVDPTQASLGQTVTSDYLRETRSSFFSFQFQTPGVASPSGDVLGTNWQRVSGSTPTDNNYYLDGAASKRWDGGLSDATLAFLPFDALQEAVVHVGGFEPEYGRATGGVIHLVTKSGGNVFSGTVDLSYSDRGLQTSGDHFDPEEQKAENRRVDLTLGGPIQRDRLWFFTAFQDFENRQTPRGAPTTFTGSGTTLFGKVSWQMNPAWSFMGRLSYVPGKGEHVGSSPLTAPEATARVELEETLGLAEMAAGLSDELLWTLRASRKRATLFDVGPEDGDLRTIGHVNLVSNEEYGNFAAQILSTSQRNAVESDLSWFVNGPRGEHELKVGLGYMEPELIDTECFVGSGRRCIEGDEGFLFLDENDAGSAPVPSLMSTFRASSPLRNRAEIGNVYLQDTWRPLPDLTLQLGLRWDRVVHRNNLEKEIADFSKLQPRIGLAWDLVGDGRTLLRASWGRFMNAGTGLLASATDVLSNPGDELWLSCSTQFGIADAGACAALAGGLGLGYRSDPEGWDPAGWILLPELVSSVEPALTVPGLRPDHTDQWLLGIEREIFERTTVELSYLSKTGRDFFETTCDGNVSQPGAAPSCDFLVVANLADMRSEYRALMLRIESRARDWLHLLGSWVTSSARGSTDLNSGVTSGFDIYPVHFENRYGYLSGHSRHRARISGYVRLPLDFTVAVFGWWDSELRWTPLEQARLIDPAFYGVRFVEPRGSRRLGSRHQLDVQVGKEFRVAETRIKLIAQAMNLLDREHPTAVCEFVTGCGGFEPGEPTTWQQPRSYEVGARLEF